MMVEFEEIKKFIKDNYKLKIIDITKKVSVDSYEHYCNIAIKNPNNLYIARRTIKNNKLFTIIASLSTDNTKEAKYLLIKNDNYHIAPKFLKASISKFVTGTDEELYKCGICFNHSIVHSTCSNCTFDMCGYCIKELFLSNNFKCPQCRIKLEVYDNQSINDMRTKFEEEHKLNIQNN